MKTLVIAALIVICCLCHHSAGSIAPVLVSKSGCCDSHYKEIVPMRRIIGMGMTPNHCQLKSVVITTVCNKICVHPELKWVKNALMKFENLTASNKPASGPFNCPGKH